MLIAQLSDPHLQATGRPGLPSLDTAARLAAALARAARHAPDLLILSGDLTEHGDAESYALASDLLAGFPAPILAIPGNHDDRDAFRAGLSGLPNLVPPTASGPLHAVAEGPIRVVGLDVTVAGAPHGQVTQDHAAWLETALSAAPRTPTLVVTHQPPFATGIGFIDTVRCFGSHLLAEVLSRHPQALRLLSGHVHRFVLTSFADRPALVAPAIAGSFALRLSPEAAPAFVAEPASFLLHLWRDGTLVSHLQAVGTASGPPPGA